jgi:mRNA m6A methyltransferase catalytic subunit
LDPSSSSSSTCSLVHFRPIIRPHTDPALGHCSYLNTCYSEPTYALSPSIPPLPSSQQHPRLVTGTSGSAGAPNANTPISLPSGLGAGGRGKEKAPCRYLHFEVDWDETSTGTATANAYKNAKRELKKKPYKLGIGQGPTGKLTEPVSTSHYLKPWRSEQLYSSYHPNGLTVTFGASITQFWVNLT